MGICNQQGVVFADAADVFITAQHKVRGATVGLHGPSAAKDAAYILATLCDQEDPTPLIGWKDEAGDHSGLMPESEQIIIARHLMHHGIVGKAKPSNKGDGKYSDKFEAAEYIAAARVHLGLSSADAEALSMTEFQTMLEMKFPELAKASDIPTREEYDAAMAALKGRKSV